MKKPFAFRQGDVMMIPAAIPAHATRIANKPLALGEKTGHHHSLIADNLALKDAVEMYEKDGQIFVSIKDDEVSLVHQEHKAHPAIVPEDYRVVIQQENSDWGARANLD